MTFTGQYREAPKRSARQPVSGPLSSQNPLSFRHVGSPLHGLNRRVLL